MPLICLYQLGLFTAYNVKQNSKVINKAGILAFVTEFQSYQERLYSKLKPHGQNQLLEFASDWFSRVCEMVASFSWAIIFRFMPKGKDNVLTSSLTPTNTKKIV